MYFSLQYINKKESQMNLLFRIRYFYSIYTIYYINQNRIWCNAYT